MEGGAARQRRDDASGASAVRRRAGPGHPRKSLTKGLPIFEARFDGAETVRVVEAGKV
ncbi:hypothetical protein HRD49_33565 [Corallococcus exiguus]|uniref:hypothetical protein n=1 Tax=Corallococcus TaxID=83461 RepID=UPI00131546AF|nr:MULTISPECIES: hypothetical protein [Corallococcus]NNC20423.1 hypothetical protein [Corallococcus exiguus]NRD54376.1 hypothetical protein [Corallococcus exiguus]NRD66683.1 hypothetical protein [Corallococcus exiguus]